MNNYTISFNKAEGQFFARYRKIGGEWGTKRISKKFQAHQTLAADADFLNWYSSYLSNGVGVSNGTRVVKTLSSMVPIWLELRNRRQTKSSHNYYKGISSTVNCWILDNPKHPHLSIQGLDLEKDFSVELVRQWLRSIDLAPGSKLGVASTLKSFFDDMLAEEKLDENMKNPLDKEAIVRELAELRDLKDNARKVNGKKFVTTLPLESVTALISDARIPMVRRIAYLVACAAGMRDNELRGLTFADLDLEAGTVNIYKQLLKPGCKPWVHYDEERARGKSREEIMSQASAVMGEPKWGEVRLIPLHPEAIKALAWWKRTGWKQAVGFSPSDADPVFPRVKSRTAVEARGSFAHCGSAELLRLDLSTLDLGTTVKGKALTFHALRHTFSSMLAARGVPREQIGYLMGHQDDNVTSDNYIEPDLALYAALVARLPLTWGNVAVDHEKAAG